MMLVKNYGKFFLGIVLLAIGGGAHSTETRIADNLKVYELKNGMKLFVYPRASGSVFTGMFYVNAGSAEENVGETGVAHLLEHMAFKGTPWIGTKDWKAERELLSQIEKTGSDLNKARQAKEPNEAQINELKNKLTDLQAQAAAVIVPNEYDNIVTREGGQETNASTSVDFTNYYMTLPSNKLELWAMLESERLMYPSWREFYQEREVVKEERRMRTEDNPFGRLYEEFVSTAFHAHPYRNPTIGWMSDLDNLTVEKTARFYDKFYVPENFTAILVGDVNPDEAYQTVNKYFGDIPKRPSAPMATTQEPNQPGERRSFVTFDASPQMLIGWHKPTLPNRDMYVIEVIQYLMSRTGRSSRLYERLVKKDGIAQEVESFTAPGDKYPNLYMIYVSNRAPHTNIEIEKAVLEEVERLKNEPVTDEELQKIRNQIDADFLKDLETNTGFSKKLGYYYVISGDPNILDKMRDEMKAVTAQDIMRVAQKYLNRDQMTVTELVSKKSEIPSDAPVPKEPTQIAPQSDAKESTATAGEGK